MKRARKIMFIINLILCVFLTVGVPKLSYADELDPFNYEPSGEVDQNFVDNYGGKISNILLQISVIVAVISVMIIGLKFIVGGVQEKADYKKNLIQVCVRNILYIVFNSNIINNSRNC